MKPYPRTTWTVRRDGGRRFTATTPRYREYLIKEITGQGHDALIEEQVTDAPKAKPRIAKTWMVAK